MTEHAGPAERLWKAVDVDLEHGWVRLGIVTGIFVFFAVMLVLMIAPRLEQAGLALGGGFVAFAVLLAVIPLYLIQQRRRWIRRFDFQGVVLLGGDRRLPWTSLKTVRRRKQRLHGRLVTSHYELIFEEGKAFVFPARVRNVREVMELLDGLVTDET